MASSSFNLIFSVAQVVAGMAIAFILYLIYAFKDGLAWTAGAPLFNFHILLMPLALSFIYGLAMLMYRARPSWYPRTGAKALHAILLGLSFILAAVGLVAVFQAHLMKNLPVLYSLHSWLGLLTVILFSAQFFVGLWSFVFPGVKISLRRVLVPFHSCSGIIIFIMSLMCVLTGLMELIVSREQKNYKFRQPFGVVGNIIGVLVTIHAVLVLILVLLPHYQRQSAASSQIVLTHPDTLYTKLATSEQ